MAPSFMLLLLLMVLLLLLLLFGTHCRLAQKMLFVGKVVRVLRQASPHVVSKQQRAPFAGLPSESGVKVTGPATGFGPS